MTVNTPIGYIYGMDTKSIINRLKRAEGQIRKVQLTVREEHDCAEVILQLLAVRGAVTATLQQYVAQAAQECGQADKEKLQTLISTLIKYS